MNKSVTEIIKEVNLIIKNNWKFDTELNTNHCGEFNTHIEDLNIIFFKKIGSNNSIEDQNKIISKIQENDYGKVELLKVSGIGKFICINLYRNYRFLINDFESFEKFKIDGNDKILKIYQFLDGKVPMEFVAYNLYNER